MQGITANRFHHSRIPLQDHAIALRTLAELLNAGLPSLKALRLLRDTAPVSWVDDLEIICVSVEQGSSVADAFQDSMLNLPPIVGGLLRAGEAGMGLSAATRQAAELLERSSNLRQSLITALAYPAILLVTGAASIALLVGIVLPKFAVILQGLGTVLPVSTRIVLSVGNAFHAVGLESIIILIIAVGAFHMWRSTNAGRLQWSEVRLQVPVIGRIEHALAASQAVHALGSLLNSGVSMAVAIEYAASAAGSYAVQNRFLQCRDSIRAGNPLSTAFDAAHAVPGSIVKLTRAGEETGRLAELLIHGAAIEYGRAQQQISRAVRLVEPGLILTFGAIVAVVAAALFQAMYSIRPGV
jgi:general secretion pathway protein F